MQSLLIRLQGKDAGILRKDSRVSFTLSRHYLDLAHRPVLGQAFEDDLRRRRIGGGGRLPAFFSNLLPEGALRDRLTRTFGLDADEEFALLEILGEDLPGAVTATPFDELGTTHEMTVAEDDEPPPSPPRDDESIRFSLAGVQLKLSMLREDERLTFPASGRGGNWIVKLPSLSWPFLPENEHATMTWAEHAGIQVAEHELLPLDRLHGVPPQLLHGLEGTAYVTRRYDRLESGRRVHQEDFAQVLDVYPERKFDATNHETLARIILELLGLDGLREYLRRLVFVILSGNGDAHLKNWSLYYPDDIHPELSPAYDLVATIQYIFHDKLALKLAKSKPFENISIASFERLARKIEVGEAEVIEVVRASVAATLAAWHVLKDDFPLPPGYRARIEDHLRRVPLARAR